jgi:UDP-N-acetylglucosamine--N-acetylmuramyl-(pentapeptide) pyrophosphoryl-undecaprenol N-acetylglucosamine transferase
MDELYTKSDIVISRSGASSVFEIIAFQKPAILIPYMKSINGDQFENAKFLESNNAAFILDETKDITSPLFLTLTELIKYPEKLTLMRNNLKKLKNTNTTKKFAELVEKTLYNKNIDN